LNNISFVEILINVILNKRSCDNINKKWNFNIFKKLVEEKSSYFIYIIGITTGLLFLAGYVNYSLIGGIFGFLIGIVIFEFFKYYFVPVIESDIFNKYKKIKDEREQLFGALKQAL